MRYGCSLSLVSGVIGKFSTITPGQMVRDRRPGSSLQTGSRRPWLVATAAWVILTSGGVGAQDAALIEEGRQLFMNETFGGNGRTCATCHPPTNNFTVDPDFIKTLKGTDPLFLTGPSLPDLKPIEVRRLLRNHALFLENVDGLDQPGVLRSVPHTLGLRQSLRADDKVGARFGQATGWSGDGSPSGDGLGDGSLRSFATGAVIQHFTKSSDRVAGDFQLPDTDQRDAMLAFQLSLGRQEEVDVNALGFTDQAVEDGKALFQEAPSRNGQRSCNFCHHNAGANVADGTNRNFATGVARAPNSPACLLGFVAPFDGGFGTDPAEEVARADVCGKGPRGGPKAISMYQGDMAMNTPPLIEAADTPPFFHNNIAATIEDAVAFYTSDTFNESPAGNGNAFVLSKGEINQIAAFLRALNALENIRSSNLYDTRAIDPDDLAPPAEMAAIALAETTDAIEVLTGGPVQLFANTNAVQLLRQARDREREALEQNPPNADLLEEAIDLKEGARVEILGE